MINVSMMSTTHEYICYVCGKTFSSSIQFKLYSNRSCFVCGMTGNALKGHTASQYHLRNLEKTKLVFPMCSACSHSQKICFECDSVYIETDKRRRETIQNLKGDVSVVFCELCAQNVDNVFGLQAHSKSNDHKTLVLRTWTTDMNVCLHCQDTNICHICGVEKSKRQMMSTDLSFMPSKCYICI